MVPITRGHPPHLSTLGLLKGWPYKKGTTGTVLSTQHLLLSTQYYILHSTQTVHSTRYTVHRQYTVHGTQYTDSTQTVHSTRYSSDTIPGHRRLSLSNEPSK